jgi:hypothetical protein
LTEEKIKLIISTPTGDTLNLNGEIRWTNAPCENEKVCIGAKIIDPSATYKEFLKTFD